MLLIGSHVSFRKDDQLLGSLKEALSYGSTTFMFYTGAPQNTNRYPIDHKLTEEAIQMMKQNDIDYSKVIVHAPYIINLANGTDPDKYQFSIHFLQDEIKRCEMLGIHYLVLHPGSHVGNGIDKGIEYITKGLNQILKDSKVTILLETMAGKGTEIGGKLEEIRKIIDGIEDKTKIGVCLDTCHLHDAGYDLDDFDTFLNEFHMKVGKSYIKCVHVNDSKNVTASHKDRHENIGFGDLGYDTLLKIIYHEEFSDIPKILETPYVDKLYAPYKEEIEMIRQKKFNPNLKEDIIKKASSCLS